MFYLLNTGIRFLVGVTSGPMGPGLLKATTSKLNPTHPSALKVYGHYTREFSEVIGNTKASLFSSLPQDLYVWDRMGQVGARWLSPANISSSVSFLLSY